MPKLQKFGTRRFYIAEFKPENVKDNKIEIPLYSNVFLEYKAEEEMSEYLERIEITEHEFNYFIKSKKTKNQYLWKCIFYFSEIPKDGILKVRFH